MKDEVEIVEEKNYCVYMHEILTNGKKYIGLSKNIEQRWSNNGSPYLAKRQDKFIHPAFAPALIKYGWDGFSHVILYTNLSREEACQKEIETIAFYRSNQREYGYNISAGGEGGGYPHSEETKKKISEHHKEFYKTHPHHCTGTHKTEAQKEHIKKLMLGREMNEEWREKLGKSHSPYIYICVETGKEYYSSGEAMRDTGIDKASIRRAADGQQTIAGNLHWEKRIKEGYEDWFQVKKSNQSKSNEKSSKIGEA